MESKLRTENVNKLLWNLSIPAMLGMMSGAIFNIVDRIFIGQVSSLGLTAIGITMPIQIFQMAFILLVGVGTSTLVSIKLGENDRQGAEDMLFLALKYSVITLGFFALIFVIFVDQILGFLEISPAVMPYAKSYILIIIVGGVISIPGYCLINSIRAVGNASVSMKIIAVSSLLNVILDPIFIFVFHMGVAGAAIATVISQTVLTVFVLVYFIKGVGLPISLHFSAIRQEKQQVIRVYKAGAPSFYIQIMATGVGIFINFSILEYGTDLDIASVTIISAIFSFFHMAVFGIVQGNQPICGYNWGAKKYDRVLKSLQLSLFYATILSLLLFAVIEIWPELLIGIFTKDQVLAGSAVHAIRIYLIGLPLVGIQTVSSQYFQSVERPNLATGLMLLRHGLILVPLVLILGPRFGVTGIFISYAASDIGAAFISMIYIFREMKRLSKMEQPIAKQTKEEYNEISEKEGI